MSIFHYLIVSWSWASDIGSCLFYILSPWKLRSVFNPIHTFILLQEHTVRTGRGSVSVIVYGDQEKPALLTYPDLALNRERFFPRVFHFKLNSSLFAVSTCFGTIVSFLTYFKNLWTFVAWSCNFLCRYVLFPRIVLLSWSSFFTASQLLHLPHQSSWAWGLWLLTCPH